MQKNITILLLVLVALWCGHRYNRLQMSDESVTASWSEVSNQYQRRADLIPNLLVVVQGYAAHEKSVLVQVAAARARVGQLQVVPDLATDQRQLDRYAAAQQQLGTALSRLMSVSESYPQLKASHLFQGLQVQLEGTENRIALARKRYIDSVESYNVQLRTFPGNLIAKASSLTLRANFNGSAQVLISRAPQLRFSGAVTGGEQ